MRVEGSGIYLRMASRAAGTLRPCAVFSLFFLLFSCELLACFLIIYMGCCVLSSSCCPCSPLHSVESCAGISLGSLPPRDIDCGCERRMHLMYNTSSLVSEFVFRLVNGDHYDCTEEVCALCSDEVLCSSRLQIREFHLGIAQAS